MPLLSKHLSLLLILVLIICSFPMAARAEGPVTVSNLDELLTAIENASYNDTIYIAAPIPIMNSVTIGAFNKHVILTVENGVSAYFLINSAIPQNAVVSFQNLYIRGGSEGGDLVILQEGNCYAGLREVVFQNNSNSGAFHAYMVSAGTASFENCSFIGSSAENGSHIYVNSGATVNLESCSFARGHAVYNGGSIYSNGNLNIRYSTFYYNEAGSWGGAIYSQGNLQITGGTISQNSALMGGGIHSPISDPLYSASITGSRIFNNSASEAAADIYAYNNLSINDTLEDYLSLLAYELGAGGFNRVGWFEDNEAFRYIPGGGSTELSIPFSYNGGNHCLAFGMYVYEPPYEPTPEPQPEPTPDPNTEPEPTPEPTPDPSPSPDSETTPPAPDPSPTPEPTPTPSEPTPESSPDPTPTPEPEPVVTPDPDPTPAPNPSPSGGSLDGSSSTPSSSSSRTLTVSVVDEGKPIEIKSGLAVMDNSAVEEFCSTITKFIPKEKPVSRGEAASIIAGLLTDESRSLFKKGTDAFTDIGASPYRDSINILAAASVLSGCGDKKYNPDTSLTWAELITLIARFTEPQEVKLTNINVNSHWAEPYIKTAVAAGWLEDKPLDLNAVVSFSDIVTFLSGVFSLDDER